MPPSPLLRALALATCVGCYFSPRPPVDPGVDTGALTETGDPSGPGGRPVTCIALDRMQSRTVPPAGIGLRFRVLGCDGDPLVEPDGAPRLLTSDDISVSNDETGEDFNASAEGGAASEPGTPEAVQVYTMLVLDFSESVFAADNAQAVVEGARGYLDRTLGAGGDGIDHRVGILAFGGPSRTAVVAEFTDDRSTLEAALAQVVTDGSRGTTDLYGAYMLGLDALEQEGLEAQADGAVVERVLVLWSDGVHEAGDLEARRAEALEAKAAYDGAAFSIYLEDDAASRSALCDLAQDDDACFGVSEASELGSVFSALSNHARALARSNYVVGVCTPVAFGEPSMTLRVRVDQAGASERVYYDTTLLTGDLSACDEAEIQALF